MQSEEDQTKGGQRLTWRGGKIIKRRKRRDGMVKEGCRVTEHHHQVLPNWIQSADRFQNQHNPARIEELDPDEKPNERKKIRRENNPEYPDTGELPF